MTMRDTPRPSCCATENLPLEFAEGGSGLPAITGALGAIGALGATGAGARDALGLSTDLSAVLSTVAICEEGAEVEAVCEDRAEAEAIFAVGATVDALGAIGVLG